MGEATTGSQDVAERTAGGSIRVQTAAAGCCAGCVRGALLDMQPAADDYRATMLHACSSSGAGCQPINSSILS